MFLGSRTRFLTFLGPEVGRHCNSWQQLQGKDSLLSPVMSWVFSSHAHVPSSLQLSEEHLGINSITGGREGKDEEKGRQRRTQ